MIVYGTSTTKIATETIADKCLNCSNQFTIQLNVYQRYVHLFWIPFLPAGKIGITQCTHCHEVLEQSNFTYSITETYKTAKSNSKTPIWIFSGVLVVAIIIAGGFIYNKQDEAKNAKIILSPQKNDVYEIKLANDSYTLYKVDKVVGDSVFIMPNKFETNQISGLADLEEKGYSEEIFPLVKNDLKIMLEKGEIMDINR
ncbi:hypothetical protein [Pedobacter frigiditerrae]|uniref:hypothetical protein n=1 Tax=Pedobacter frigiditerrae TaxID=2530452 RepID=UPI002931B77D|nr:hypothetical protein [Pedobacter frigiditerrae]